MDEKFESKEINTLHSEHLNKGVRPIIASVGAYKDIPEDFSNTKEFENIKWDASKEELKEKGLLNAGRETYVISPLDDKNKSSEGFLNCTGVIGTGLDKTTEKNISFLSHQFFGKLADKNVNRISGNETWLTSFISDLNTRLAELKERSVSGTVDVVIIGGTYFNLSGGAYQTDYKEAIRTLSQNVKNMFGFEPVVITGPKTSHPLQEEDVFYDTENRRLYLTRPKTGNPESESYLPIRLGDQEKKWRPRF